jgi:hypothetical protein
LQFCMEMNLIVSVLLAMTMDHLKPEIIWSIKKTELLFYYTVWRKNKFSGLIQYNFKTKKAITLKEGALHWYIQ